MIFHNKIVSLILLMLWRIYALLKILTTEKNLFKKTSRDQIITILQPGNVLLHKVIRSIALFQ